MKQIPPNPNYPGSYQPFQSGSQWAPYQQVAQQAQNIGNQTSTTKQTGMMDLLKKLNPAGGNLTETLDQIQNFLKMAQNVTPKIQEYGPLIKNLPAILAMMKEMDLEEDEEADTEEQKDDSTDVLDQLLGLDEEDQDDKEDEKEHEDKNEKQLTPNVTVENRNQENNLYKIETLDEQIKPKYQEPMLFI